MDRILLATLGSLGDLHPYIAVGKALLARGQPVRLATSVDYRARIEAAGMEFAPLAPSIAELGDPELIAKQFFEPWKGPERLLKAMVTAPLRRAYGDLCAAVEGVSMAVSHPITPALPLIAESRGLPWLSSVLAPYSLFSHSNPSMIPNFEWLDRLPGVAARAHGWLLKLARLRVRRWEQPRHELLPSSVAAFDYLPYSRVFPRAAAIVHQAGIGTLAVALRSGRPQLLTPVGFDQPDNAARAARLGVGRVLPFRRAHNPVRLARELRTLLEDSHYASAAEVVAEKLRCIDGAAAAAEFLIGQLRKRVHESRPSAPT